MTGETGLSVDTNKFGIRLAQYAEETECELGYWSAAVDL